MAAIASCSGRGILPMMRTISQAMNIMIISRPQARTSQTSQAGRARMTRNKTAKRFSRPGLTATDTGYSVSAHPNGG